MSVQLHSPQTSAVAAMEHVLEAAQQTALDRLQLYALELRLAVLGAAHAAALGAVGVTALLLGWMCLLGAATGMLMEWLAWWQSLAVVGSSQLVMGLVMVLVSRAVASREHP